MCVCVRRYRRGPESPVTTDSEKRWVLRWLIRPILARNNLLQVGQLKVGAWRDVIAACAFLAARFTWTVLVLVSSALLAPVGSATARGSGHQFHRDSVLMLNTLRESLTVFELCSWTTSGALTFFELLVQKLFWYHNWESDIRVTWYAQRICDFCSIVWMLGRLVRLRTSVPGILFCHFI